MTKLFSFRTALVAPAIAALLLPSAAAAQQIQLLAGGDTEWSPVSVSACRCIHAR